MKKEEIQKIKDSDCDVRSSVACNPNTSADSLVELAKDSHWSVRRSVAGNPNTSADALVELAKDSHWSVRSSVACNPNTSADSLVELAKDSHWSVRSSVAGNPNTSADALVELAKDSHWSVRSSVAGRKFIINTNSVSTQGTNNLWTKVRYNNCNLYKCGCFFGTHEQLLSRIRNTSSGYLMHERLRILAALDKEFNKVFG